MTTDLAERARQAIQLVCAGDLSHMGTYYSPDFVDHVNDMTFHGYDGGAESVGFYRALFPDLRFSVDEQLVQGDRVASHWALHGTYLRRAITLRGITISRFGDDGRIVEDRGYSDSLSFVRQLGLLRCLALGLAVATRRVRLPRGALAGRDR